MKFKNIIACMSLFFLGAATMMTAQTDQGTIVLEITDVTSDNPQMAQVTEMMKGNETMLYFQGKQSMTKMNMMGGMIKIDLKVSEDESSDMLMDMMGQKIWVNTSKLESDRMKAETDNPLEEMDVTYDMTDTKEIAGYNCYKMNVSFPDQADASLSAYVTEDIKINAPVIQGVNMEEFNGFPLEYAFNNGLMNLTITTKSFENSVDATVFDLNTSGYQKMTMQELMEMSGGMGGFGF